MHKVTSHKRIDHSSRVKGKYWGVDTTGQQDAAIITGNRYKTTFVEFVTCFIVNFYHVDCENSSILEIIRKFDSQILGILKSQGIVPIFLRSDNGQFKSNNVRAYCVQAGIVQYFTALFHSSSNGDAERAIGKVKSMAKKHLAHALLSNIFWELSDRNATYISNRIPFTRDGIYVHDPMYQLYGHIFDLSIIRTFGCPAVVFTDKKSKDYMPSGMRGIFVGRVFIPSLHEIIESGNVRFDESVITKPGGPFLPTIENTLSKNSSI